MKKLSLLGLLLLLLLPNISIGQEETEEPQTNNKSPFEIDLTIKGHSLFGKAIDILPEKFKMGIAYEAALRYDVGNFGLALEGGFWKNEFQPEGSGALTNATYRQRLDDFSAHYILFGPYFSFGQNNFSVQINPKAGVQRFYFPHFSATVPSGVGGNTLAQRVRSDFDSGISTGVGLKALIDIDESIAIHFKVDYLTTLGDGAFRYRLQNITPSSNVTLNTSPLQTLSFGAGASLALNKRNSDTPPPSLAPSALDVSLGGGINFLSGKGIDNLRGDHSAGYNVDLTLNYRIGRSGVAIRGGFWDNKYETTRDGLVIGPGINATIYQRLDNVSAHYLSFGPIIPLTSKNAKSVKVELVPNIGIQRIYFPHNRVTGTVTATGNSYLLRRVRTNLDAAWSAGATANILFALNDKLDLKIFGDYMGMLTNRGFGFTNEEVAAPLVGTSRIIDAAGLPSYGRTGKANRETVDRYSFGAGVVYNLFSKAKSEDDGMSPDEIKKMIDEKEDEEMKDESIDMQVGGDKKDTDTTDPEQEITDPTGTKPPVTTDPTTTDPVTDPRTEQTDPTTQPPPTTTRPTTPVTTYVPPTVYRVQFVALSKDVKVFNDLKQYGTVILEYYSTKGLYRYMVGDATTVEEGLQLLDTIHRNGWPKAFLVRYQNGVRTRVR